MSILQKIINYFAPSEEESLPQLGRNDLCWCGSGKKYKRCHLEEDEKKRSKRRASACKTN